MKTIYQTGANPTFTIFRGATQGFCSLPFQEGDMIASYFKIGETNYINGCKPAKEGVGCNLVSFLNCSEDPGMPEDILSGAPPASDLFFCLLRGGKYYDLIPLNIELYTDVTKPAEKIQAYPLTIYTVEKIVIDLEKEIELEEVPYLSWYNSQCPVLPVNEGETLEFDVQINFYKKGILKHTDGRVWETNKKGVLPSFSLGVGQIRYSIGTNITAVDGNGTIEKSTYSTIYKQTKSDVERGSVTFKVEVNKFSGCGLKTNPYYFVKYNFLTLPDPENPLVLIKEADPPPLPGFVPVEFAFDRVIASGDYWKLVVKGSEIYFINNLNYPVSIEIREVNNTRMRVGAGISKATARLLNLKINDRQLLNKNTSIKVTSWQAKIDETKTFVFK